MEVGNISELHDTVERISIPVARRPSLLEQNYQQRRRKQRKWAVHEQKKNPKRGYGGDRIFIKSAKTREIVG